MERCDLLVDVGRRRFLSGAGVAAAGAAASTLLSPPTAAAAVPTARVNYPSTKLGNVKDLKPNEPMNVAYPDADAPGVLIKLGKRVEGGAGPGRRRRRLLDDVPAQGLSPCTTARIAAP